MPSSLKLKNQLEAALASKVPHALTPAKQIVHHLTASGLQMVDEILQGGLRCSAITELVGLECSGRTSMALAYMAAITKTSGVCAWIDVADALDPESAVANGVDLERLLWVRCGSPHPAFHQSAYQALQPLQNSASIAVLGTRHTSGISPHPRSEGRDMSQALCTLLHAQGGLPDGQLRREKKSIGTPGMPNRPLSWRSEHREEQVNSDRMPPRRGDNLVQNIVMAPRYVELQPRRNAGLHADKPAPGERLFRTGLPSGDKIWHALDHALRSTDLLLQGGGFSAIVLDLGSVPAEVVWRIPLATWFRFHAACKRTRISLLLLTQHPCARSSAALVVRLETGSIEAESKVMTGIRYSAVAERSRTQENDARVVPIRKGPQSEQATFGRPGQWTSQAAWVRSK